MELLSSSKTCNLFLRLASISEDWEAVDVNTYVYKVFRKSQMVSLMSVLGKLVERVTDGEIMKYREEQDLLKENQHGFSYVERLH